MNRTERGSATRSNFARPIVDKTNGNAFESGACCGSESRAPVQGFSEFFGEISPHSCLARKGRDAGAPLWPATAMQSTEMRPIRRRRRGAFGWSPGTRRLRRGNVHLQSSSPAYGRFLYCNATAE